MWSIARALTAAAGHERAGRFDEAVTLYLRCLSDDPAAAAAQSGLGLALTRCGHGAIGIRAARRAALSAPNDPVHAHNLGAVSYALGRHGEAAAFFTRAAAMSPTFAPPADELERMAPRGELGSDGASGRSLVALHPDRPGPYAILAAADGAAAETAADTTRIMEAVLAHQRVATIDPGRSGARGASWRARGRLKGDDVYHSSEGQDVFIHQTLLPRREGGVFVDIGAYDGVTGSNTLFFERVLGWTGLCVEASPGAYAELTANRRCASLNAAIIDFDGEATFLDVTDGPRMVGGLVETYDPRARTILDREAPDATRRERRVPARSPHSALREAGIHRVDYCSIDVEGAERRILEAWDVELFPVEVFSIENNFSDPSLRPYMAERGYVFIARLGHDDIFRRRESETAGSGSVAPT